MSRSTNDVAEAARKDLIGNGFAVVEELFSPSDVGLVADLFDEVVRRVDTVPPGRRPRSRVIARTGAGDRPSGADYQEIFYPASLKPALLDSNVYVRCSELARALDQGHSMYFNSLIIKYPNSDTNVLWHRDGDFSPLRILGRWPPRLSFWIPLQDTTPSNGGLEFLAQSHLDRNSLHVLENRRIRCSIPIGGLSIHTPLTLHCSGRNASGHRRAAWLLTFGRFGSQKLSIKRFLGHLPNAL